MAADHSRDRTACGSLQAASQMTCSKNQPSVYCYLLIVEFKRKGTYNIFVSNSLAAAA